MPHPGHTKGSLPPEDKLFPQPHLTDRIMGVNPDSPSGNSRTWASHITLLSLSFLSRWWRRPDRIKLADAQCLAHSRRFTSVHSLLYQCIFVLTHLVSSFLPSLFSTYEFLPNFHDSCHRNVSPLRILPRYLLARGSHSVLPVSVPRVPSHITLEVSSCVPLFPDILVLLHPWS